MRDDRRAHSLSWHSPRKAFAAAQDSQVRKHIKEALSRAGYAADVVEDVRMILKHPKTAGHSFLVLEKGVAATDVVRQLRKLGTDTPVIILSGGPGEDLLPDSGPEFVEHLALPFTLKSLQVAIDRVLGERPQGDAESS
jgi:DNA-binding NtrC family response regulator